MARGASIRSLHTVRSLSTLHRVPVRPAAAAFAGAAILAGCQRYQARPLDLPEHREEFAARAPGDEPVRAFAQSLAAPGQPAAFDPADGVSLAEGEIVALVFNPDLRLARLRAGVATATAEHAGLWDDPEFSIDVLRITESVSNPWVISPGLAFTIPLSGRLDAEKKRAEASLRAELVRIAEQEWAVRLELQRQWVRWSAARLRAERTAALLESIESLVGSTMQLAEAGELPQTEAGLFTIERASHARALMRWRGEAAEAEQRLRALMGLSPAAPLELVPLLSLEETPSAISGDELAERNLGLARLREEYAAAEQSLRREIRRQYPDLTLGPLYESDQGQSRIGFLGAIPLPLLNANRQGIAEAEAEREFARAAFETEYERLAGSLAAARIRHDTLREQRRLLETEIVPLVDRQLAAARRLLELGEGGGGSGGGLVLLESLSRVGEAQMELIEARLAESLAAIELAAIAGPPAASPALEPTTDRDNTSAAGEPAAPLDEVTP
jgi:outer membrane protein, heavy metal efflux system